MKVEGAGRLREGMFIAQIDGQRRARIGVAAQRDDQRSVEAGAEAAFRAQSHEHHVKAVNLHILDAFAAGSLHWELEDGSI